MTDIVVFKIRSKTTGLFSTGGSYPRWSKKGKTWNMRGHVSSHLSGLCGTGRMVYRQADAEVVECVIREENIGTVPVSEWLADVERRKAEKESSRQAASEDHQRQQRLAEYKRLQKEFGDA